MAHKVYEINLKGHSYHFFCSKKTIFPLFFNNQSQKYAMFCYDTIFIGLKIATNNSELILSYK